MAKKIQDICCDTYLGNLADWEKWRYVYRGGRPFIEKYLRYFSNKEDQEDYLKRRDMAFGPCFAKSEVKAIRDAIYERMVDIVRETNCPTYNEAVLGRGGGVDNLGSTMNHFMGVSVLDELLPMRQVGVFVDMPSAVGNDRESQASVRPYVYTYSVEQIRSWKKDSLGNYTAVLLEDYCDQFDPVYNLPFGKAKQYRLVTQVSDGVKFEIFNEKSEPVSTVILPIPKIPFDMGDIRSSLLEDIADYQIALLNLESSDLEFLLNANFTFFVEQYDKMTEMMALQRGAMVSSQVDPDGETEGSAAVVEQPAARQMHVGPQRGLRIPSGVEPPSYISPPTDNVKASMAKQEAMKRDIKLLLNQTLSGLKSERSSAESKQADQSSEEEGLAFIGLELNRLENRIAEFWCMYEGIKKPAIVITYPTNYALRTFADRVEESKEILDLVPQIPSKTFRLSLLKHASRTLLQGKILPADLNKINTELDNAKAAIRVDPKVLDMHAERGICSAELASSLSGYPDGDVQVAQKEQEVRAAAVALAQSKANQAGVADLKANTTDDEKAKEAQKDNSLDPTPESHQRGEGK